MGWGTDHLGIGTCRMHGGKTANAEKHAERVLAERQVVEIATLAQRIRGTDGPPADPTDIILAWVRAAAWNVQTLEEVVNELPTHPEDDVLERTDGGKPYWQRGRPGLYGRIYAISGIPTGEAKPHVLVQMLNEERDRAFSYAAQAAKLGIEQHRLELEMVEVQRLFAAVSWGLAHAGIPREQQDIAKKAIGEKLRTTVQEPVEATVVAH